MKFIQKYKLMEARMMKIITCPMVPNEWNIMKTIDGMNQDVLGNG